MSKRIFVFDLEPLPQAVGFGLFVTWGKTQGVTIFFGWWVLEIGLRGIGI